MVGSVSPFDVRSWVMLLMWCRRASSCPRSKRAASVGDDIEAGAGGECELFGVAAGEGGDEVVFGVVDVSRLLGGCRWCGRVLR